MRTRLERDSLGKKSVPADAFYGIFTARALENFKLSGLAVDRGLLKAYATVKLCAARANAELGVLDKEKGRAIQKAAREVLQGRFDNQFALDAFTAGAGTPFNMNVNEVIANRANDLLGGRRGRYDRVHPNNHVNLGQSSNDVTPTAARIAVLWSLEDVVRQAKALEKSLEKKASQFRSVVKASRTHLQDAVPITLGQEFHAYAAAVQRARKRLERAMNDLADLGIGGTACGTGFGSHPRFAAKMVALLKNETGLRLRNQEEKAYATQFMGDLFSASQAMTNLAVETKKVCFDLRLLSSGPNTGFNEIALPEVEPGSSIMPGKVNPSIAEAMEAACIQIAGCNHAVELAAGRGELDLNVFSPLIAFNLLFAARLLGNGLEALEKKCVRGVKANKAVCAAYFENSSANATLLAPVIGYAEAADVFKSAVRHGRTVRWEILSRGLLSKKALDELLSPKNATKPNLDLIRRHARKGKG